ncbi:response regulator [Citreicoccus inhibens]|uniref:response regulator n=1 Tax=Citreicoccus inhibens TaxID=2849499 RepID=UPI00268325D0|nr:response regulator [Citreicoccus inhibens]
MNLLIVSGHTASRELLGRILADTHLTVRATGDVDEALTAITAQRPALVVVDLRRPDEDPSLFIGLLRKRHPTLPVIALIPGRLRVFDGREERVVDAPGDSAEALHQMLVALKRAVSDVCAHALLGALKPPVGKA